jgi:hypothetical protein
LRFATPQLAFGYTGGIAFDCETLAERVSASCVCLP